MQPRTLKNIKRQLREFLPIVQATAKHWNSSQYTTISVLLQNAGFDASSSSNYNHRRDEDEIYEILEILKKISEYKKSHFETWVYEEVKQVVNLAVSEEDTVGYLTN